ncbi:membrane protein [Paenibacillus sp. FSL H7-0357]|uniref:hypothetical protein n=1 Tax=Paenibacillus sp. FSL H7-0357 TaxID=1536774 RepID=UPI0004F61640|nr:membrane protein [Paenibacillus sp. FSL H7-0357]
MGITELAGIIELLAGLIINVWIGAFGRIIFKKDDKISRVVLRILGVFLLINGISRAFHV